MEMACYLLCYFNYLNVYKLGHIDLSHWDNIKPSLKKFEDTKGVIRSHNSNNIQYNDQKKKDKRTVYCKIVLSFDNWPNL